MKKTTILNGLLFLVMMLCVFAYCQDEHIQLKMASSFCFVLAAILNFDLKKIEPDYASMMLVGICVSMLGDIALYYAFIIGGVLFVLGHLIIVYSISRVEKYTKKDFVVAAVFFLIIEILLYVCANPIKRNSPIFYLSIVYCLIISVTAGKSILLFVHNKTAFTKTILAGTLLFVISDVMLLLAQFGSYDFPFVFVERMLYFPGLFILAQSIRYFNRMKTE